MPLGIILMDHLIRDNHIGYCIHCHEWTAFTKHPGNALTCLMCGNFGSPIASPYNSEAMRRRLPCQ